MNNENNEQKENQTEQDHLTAFVKSLTDNKHILTTVQGGVAAVMLGRLMAVPPQFSFTTGLILGALQAFHAHRQEEAAKAEKE